MYTKIQVVFDAADPEKLAEFWGLALGYVVEPPPEGFESWEDFAGSAGIPEDQWDEVSSRVDPAGEGPRLYFQRVPEGKTAKNRIHLDIRVADREVRGEARRRLVSEHVERLVQAGASLAWRTDDVRGSSVTLYDPEGNEFCVTLFPPSPGGDLSRLPPHAVHRIGPEKPMSRGYVEAKSHVRRVRRQPDDHGRQRYRYRATEWTARKSISFRPRYSAQQAGRSGSSRQSIAGIGAGTRSYAGLEPPSAPARPVAPESNRPGMGRPGRELHRTGQ